MPLLSIGLPVYNGERYLRQALDSLLQQGFSDYEVFVSDNASTDDTSTIAREYAALDDRIRYHRNAQNLGAAANFNLTFRRTSGPYFKWASHDDLMHPDFLESCIAALEENLDAVLAYPRARIIDERGEPLFDYDPKLSTDSGRCATRFESVLAYHKCYQIFGIIRREALDKTKLIGLHAHGDGVLLAHLALLGRFVEIPQFFFFPRVHPHQSMTMIGNYWVYAQWFNPELSGKLTFPHWRMFAEYLRCVITTPLAIEDRLGCLKAWSRVIRQRWRLLRGDVLFYVRPALVAMGVPERLLRRRSKSPTA